MPSLENWEWWVSVALPIIVGAQSMAIVHGYWSYAVIHTMHGIIYIFSGVCTQCKYVFYCAMYQHTHMYMYMYVKRFHPSRPIMLCNQSKRC